MVRVQARDAQNGAVLTDDLYLMAGTLSDNERRGQLAPVEWMRGSWEQNPVTWWGPTDRHAQIVVRSRRPYPTFDATRVVAGSADADVTDCE